MKRAIFILALLVTGCGVEESEPKEFDPELASLVHYYLAFAPDKGELDKLAVMKFGDVDKDGKQAWCQVENIGSPFERREITVEPREDRGYLFKTTVMHELGHCLHDLEHSDEPYAIMNPQREGDEAYWQENFDAKLAEMF